MQPAEDLDIEQIMEQIRSNIRRRSSPRDGVIPEDITSEFRNRHVEAALDYLHSGYDIQRISFSSRRRILGPCLIAFRKALRKLLAPILELQVAYNASNTRVVA